MSMSVHVLISSGARAIMLLLLLMMMMMMMMSGIAHLLFPSSGNHYTWRKVTTTVNNIIVGRLWVDNHGEMDIKNHTTGDNCHLKFYAYSYFSREVPRKVRHLLFSYVTCHVNRDLSSSSLVAVPCETSQNLLCAFHSYVCCAFVTWCTVVTQGHWFLLNIGDHQMGCSSLGWVWGTFHTASPTTLLGGDEWMSEWMNKNLYSAPKSLQMYG